jgi:hypothetical protein
MVNKIRKQRAIFLQEEDTRLFDCEYLVKILVAAMMSENKARKRKKKKKTRGAVTRYEMLELHLTWEVRFSLTCLFSFGWRCRR